MTDLELMQQALEALDHFDDVDKTTAAITALRERLAQPEREPVARPLTDELMDCVDRLGSEADLVDPRVWDHLLVYAPKPARPEQEPVAWRWSESNGQHWFDWRTDWTHHDRAKAMGFPIEYAAPTPRKENT